MPQDEKPVKFSCGIRINTFTITYPLVRASLDGNVLALRFLGFRLFTFCPDDILDFKVRDGLVQLVYRKGRFNESLFIWTPSGKLASALEERGFDLRRQDDIGKVDYAMQTIMDKSVMFLFIVLAVVFTLIEFLVGMNK